MKPAASTPTAINRAKVRAKRLYPRSEGFQGAYLKGAMAADANCSADVCPYKNRKGWAAWRRAWLRGFQSVSPSP